MSRFQPEQIKIDNTKGVWKQAVKNGQSSSRILNKQPPVKFSPAKDIQPQLVQRKSFILKDTSKDGDSQPDSGIRIKRKSSTKDKMINKRQQLHTQRSQTSMIKMQKQQSAILPSQMNKRNYQDFNVVSPTKQSKKQYIKYFAQIAVIKKQFQLFKSKIINDIKRYQEDIKKTIQHILGLFKNHQKKITQAEEAPPQNNNQPSNFVIKISSQKIGQNFPRNPIKFETKYTISSKLEQTSQKNEISQTSLLPQIKNQVSKFFELVSQLRQILNDSPSNQKLNFINQQIIT